MSAVVAPAPGVDAEREQRRGPGHDQQRPECPPQGWSQDEVHPDRHRRRRRDQKDKGAADQQQGRTPQGCAKKPGPPEPFEDDAPQGQRDTQQHGPQRQAQRPQPGGWPSLAGDTALDAHLSGGQVGPRRARCRVLCITRAICRRIDEVGQTDPLRVCVEVEERRLEQEKELGKAGGARLECKDGLVDHRNAHRALHRCAVEPRVDRHARGIAGSVG